MPAPQITKSAFLNIFTGTKKRGLPGSPDLDAAEKAQCPQRITAEGLEMPQKSCEPQNVAFRTFIKPYNKRSASCQSITIIVTAFIMVIVIIVLLVLCGVFQVAKDRAEGHTTGEVLESYPTSTAIFY